MIFYPVRFNQRDKILRCKTCQCRLTKIRVSRDKILRRHLQIREIAAPPARNQNFLTRRGCVVEHQHPLIPLPRNSRTKQPRCPRTHNNHVKRQIRQNPAPDSPFSIKSGACVCAQRLRGKTRKRQGSGIAIQQQIMPIRIALQHPRPICGCKHQPIRRDVAGLHVRKFPFPGSVISQQFHMRRHALAAPSPRHRAWHFLHHPNAPAPAHN